MIFHDMYVALKTVIRELYAQMAQNKKAGKLAKDVLIMAILLGVGIGGFKLYKYYTFNKQATAQKVLSECLVEYERAEAGTASWYDVEVALEMGYEQHAGSKLAPYFLAYKAEAMYEQGKKKEAIESTKQALEKMSPKDDLYGVYNVKLALMKMDSETESVQQEGLRLLEKIALGDDSGKAGALYNLGVYYWDKDNTEKAAGYFKQLAAMEIKKEGELPGVKSQYMTMAQEKLDQLN